MSDKVRVRFAPSPTGPLHIGGVRTALFNYLFAKKNKGDFILRIEDTDQTRFVEGAEQYIIDSLNWLGLNIDEGVSKGGEFGPYRQSERKDMYLPLAEKLISNGWAYYAFDTPEELNALRSQYEAEKKTFAYDLNIRGGLNNSLNMSDDEVQEKLNAGMPYIVRFKMPEGETVGTNDVVRGDVKFNTSTLDDKVIFKSDGLPTYHLANVADDHAMKITHVIRGEEWLPSLPLHILLYKALGWENEMPVFAHLPLILKPNGKGKLSKRDGDKEGFPVFPLEWKPVGGETSTGYRESGYYPEAVVNLLVLLGWNPGTEQEVFSLEELIEVFDLGRVNKAGARFDPDKAKWFNEHYLKQKGDVALAEEFMTDVNQRGINANKAIVEKVIPLVKERVQFVHQMWEQSSYFFIAPTEYDAKTRKKAWKEQTPDIINACLNILVGTEDFSSSNTETLIKTYIEENELGFGKVMNPLRLAIVGAGKGPHLFDIMEIIGKDESITRIKSALEIL